ncbi:MAG: hypothetical protein RIB67_00310 [Miltoncostaeaceae bacterium]
MEAGAAPERLTVSMGDRFEDVDPALGIIHDGFVSAGYMEPRPSGRRMHPAYLNPGGIHVVARMGSDVVGTIIMVADGPFGLPSDRAFIEEIDQLRADRSVREVGSLVVDARFRRHTRTIYMHMLATIVRAIVTHASDAHIILSVSPESVRFTAQMFECDLLTQDRRPLYGEPAVLLHTTASILTNCYRDGATASRREMGRLVFARGPEWLDEHPLGAEWPADWLNLLVCEADILRRLQRQKARVDALLGSSIEVDGAGRLPHG